MVAEMNSSSSAGETHLIESKCVNELRNNLSSAPRAVTLYIKEKMKVTYITVKAEFFSGIVETVETPADVQLIDAVIGAMLQHYELLKSYNADEHSPYESQEGEDMRMNMIHTMLGKHSKCIIHMIEFKGKDYYEFSFYPGGANRKIVVWKEVDEKSSELVEELKNPGYRRFVQQ